MFWFIFAPFLVIYDCKSPFCLTQMSKWRDIHTSLLILQHFFLLFFQKTCQYCWYWCLNCNNFNWFWLYLSNWCWFNGTLFTQCNININVWSSKLLPSFYYTVIFFLSFSTFVTRHKKIRNKSNRAKRRRKIPLPLSQSHLLMVSAWGVRLLQKKKKKIY